jgi:hypothetical protein
MNKIGRPTILIDCSKAIGVDSCFVTKQQLIDTGTD